MKDLLFMTFCFFATLGSAQIPGDYKLDFQVTKICVSGGKSDGQATNWRWRVRVKDFNGLNTGAVWGMDNSSLDVCLTADKAPSIGRSLPYSLLSENYNISSGKRFNFYLDFYAYEKDCLEGNSHNGDNLNYKANCYCGLLGTFRCSEKDDDYYLEALNQPFEINLLAQEPGYFSSEEELQFKTGNGVTYSFTIRYRIIPPVPIAPITINSNSICSNEVYDIQLATDLGAEEYIWYENTNYQLTKICESLEQSCISDLRNHCADNFDSSCECIDCLDNADPESCLLECSPCAVCREELNWREIARTSTPSLLIDPSGQLDSKISKLYAVKTVSNGLSSLGQSPAGAAMTIFRQAAQVFESGNPSFLPSQLGSAEIVRGAEIQHVECFGENSGSLKIYGLNEENGGTGLYTFRLYQNAQIASVGPINLLNGPATFTGLTAGIYRLRTINISDGSEYCFSEATFQINQPLNPLDAQLNFPNRETRNGFDITCSGEADGSLKIAPFGGSNPYFYTLNGEKERINPVFDSLKVGIYQLEVFDYFGCTTTKLPEIKEPQPMLVSKALEGIPLIEAEPYHISCDGKADASANLSFYGGVSPYQHTLFLNDSLISSFTREESDILATDLPAGMLKWMVLDGNGCEALLGTTEILQPPPLKRQKLTISPPVCRETASAAIEIRVDDPRISSFTYGMQYDLISADNKLTTKINFKGDNQSIKNLNAGQYQLTATSLHPSACVLNESLSIQSLRNDSLVISDTQEYPPSCSYTSDGMLNFKLSGGGNNYYAQVSDGPIVPLEGNNFSLENISNDDSGTLISFFDENHKTWGIDKCAINSQVSLAAPEPLHSNIELSNISCYHLQDGKVKIHPYGGNGQYTIKLDHQEYQEGRVFESLDAGWHKWVVQDQKNCLSSADSFFISRPRPLKIKSLQLLPTSCLELADGKLFVQSEGGRGTHLYSLDSLVSFNGLFNQLESGNYDLRVIDDYNCKLDTALYLNSDPFPFSIKTDPPFCKRENSGSIHISPINHAKDLLYTLNDSITSTDGHFTDLRAGLFQIKVTGPQCNWEQSVELPANLLEIDSLYQIKSTCFEPNGKGYIQISGGLPPYTSQWYSSSGTLVSPNELNPGKYFINVIDQAGCLHQRTWTQLNELSTSQVVDIKRSTNCNGKNGVANFIGSSTDYNSISWSSGEIGWRATQLPAGENQVQWVDEFGCTKVADFWMDHDQKPLFQVINEPSNCDQNNGYLEIVMETDQQFDVYWADGDRGTIRRGMSPGKYPFEIHLSNDCILDGIAEVNQSSDLQLKNIDIEASECGLSNGTVSFHIEGGAPPYQVYWDHAELPQPINQINQLENREYHYRIEDHNNCSLENYVLVPQKQVQGSLNYDVIVSDAQCELKNGHIEIKPTGGQPPYEIFWPELQKTQLQVSELMPDSYRFILSDQSGCSIESVAKIGSQKLPKPMVEIENNPCFGDLHPIRILNLPSLSTQTLLNGELTNLIDLELEEGLHSIQFITEKCESEILFFAINKSEPLQIESEITFPSCADSQDGIITITDTKVDRVNWQDTQENSLSREQLSSTIYHADLYLKNGCRVMKSFDLRNPDSLQVATLIAIPPDCSGGENGSIYLEATGGQAPYNITWTNGKQGSQISNLEDQTYVAEITDSKLCKISEEVILDRAILDNSTNLPDSIYLCLGEDKPLIANPTLVNEWYFDGELVSREAQFSPSKSGSLVLKQSDLSACSSLDTSYVAFNNIEVKADFILPTQILSGDTLVAINLSSPAAANISWSLPEQAISLEETPHGIEFIMPEPGLFEMGLSIKHGNCRSDIIKRIDVLTNRNPVLGKLDKAIKIINLFPNPGKLPIQIDYELSRKTDSNIQIFDLNTGIIVKNQLFEAKSSVSLSLPASALKPGIYILILTVEEESRHLKFRVL